MRRFMFELAQQLGMTVAELGVRMSAAELTEWQALRVVEADEREKQAKKDEADAKRRR